MSLLDNLKKLKNLNPESQVAEFSKKAAKYLTLGVSAAFLTALAWANHLGKVALSGFKVGATAGGVGGAIWGGYIGIQVGIALAPYTFGISLIVAPPLGALIGFLGGATLLGIAGALIALGLDQGAAGLVSTGIGAGAGTIVGTYVAGSFISFAVGVCAATIFGCLLVPVAVISAPIIITGFAILGGLAGYVIGNYVIDPIVSRIEGIPIGSISTSGFWSGLGSTFTSLGSWFVNGLTSAGGSLLSSALSVGSNLLGMLSGGSTVAVGKIAAISVGTTVAAAATMTIINNGVLTPGKFATTQTDKSQNIIPPPGSAYLTVTKTATPSSLQNSDLPKTINFEVTLTAKSVKLINVTCEDLTTLVKSNGSTAPLTISPTPSCPSTIDANAQIKFNFTTQAQNTPDFQNASIINVFNVYYDIESLALGSCGAGSGFSNLLPNPIPPSVGAVSPTILNRLNSPGQVVPAAVYGAQKSGVACELLVGLDYVEASWYDDGSFISGRTLGMEIEPDVTSAADCTAYGGTWNSGCKFSSLQDTAYYAGDLIKVKMGYLGFGNRPPATFNEMVGAMSYYNGGGNHNCGRPVPYTGPCPSPPDPPIGIDDSYVMTHFDTAHETMYKIYCGQYTDADGVVHGIPCDPPKLFDRDGAATAAKEYYKAGAGPFP